MFAHESFGTWMKRQRQRYGLSQGELAEAVHCSKGLIHKLEAGTQRPGKQLAEAIARLFNVPETEIPNFVLKVRGQVVPSTAVIDVPDVVTSFIGRDMDMQAVREKLIQQRVRLLTLTGPPGIGKTRLAIEAVKEMYAEFKDGISFVSLSPLNDPSHVLSAIVAALRLEEQADQRAQIIRYLAQKQFLLLLDNFEHLLDAARLVTDLLNDCQYLKILVTSRAPLNQYREVLYTVPALALPQRDGTLDEIAHAPAITLFVERARAARSSFELTVQNAVHVAAICARLDRIPLAIELASARIKLFEPDELLARLDRRLGSMTEGGHTDDPRQKTLLKTLEWSYALLNANERTLLARLGVFTGGCTIEAIEKVCGGDIKNVLSMLDSLVDHNLVQHAPGPNDSLRYTLLESIHEFASKKLDASGEESALLHAHANYFAEMMEEFDAQMLSGKQLLLLKFLKADLDNIRAALRWSLNNEHDTALRLAGNFVGLAWLAGMIKEVWEWLQEAQKVSAGAPLLLRTKVSFSMFAFAFYGMKSLTWGSELGEQAARVYRSVNDPLLLSRALSAIGWRYTLLGDRARAEEALQEALALVRMIGRKDHEVIYLWFLGISSPPDKAMSIFEEAYRLAREVGCHWPRTDIAHRLAAIYINQEQLDKAKSILGESQALGQEMDTLVSNTWRLGYQGEIARQRGERAEAVDLIRRALLSSYELMNHLGTILHLVQCAQMIEQSEDAAQLLGAVAVALESLRLHFYSMDQIYYEQALERIRTSLPTETFNAALVRGRAMSIEDAVNYALEQLEN